jgi:hypothetical protein
MAQFFKPVFVIVIGVFVSKNYVIKPRQAIDVQQMALPGKSTWVY